VRTATKPPIQLATRLALDVISYSNPLPPWFDVLTIDYEARQKTIARKLAQYLDGVAPIAPFEILVPNKSQVKKRWLIPSVNDQIVLQTLVSALAEKVNSTLDSARVLSYRYDREPHRLQLTASQVRSWASFELETEQRLKEGRALLQFDLEAAFRSIDRRQFDAFLAGISQDGESRLLSHLINTLDPPAQGLPLVNDSVFFLGNAYLSVVDRIVERHALDFIRFVDDYRVFDDSPGTLEKSLAKIERDLDRIGFRINRAKLKLSSSEQYLAAVAKGKYATTTSVEGYISAVVFDDVVEPNKLVELVSRAIAQPSEYLNEGFGRLILGAIRRLRLNERLALRKNFPGSPRDEFSAELAKKTDTIARATELLDSYGQNADEVWRVVWLLFVMDDMRPSDRSLAARCEAAIEAVRTSSDSPLLVRLWANKLRGGKPGTSPATVEELHDLGYFECGVRLYGQ